MGIEINAQTLPRRFTMLRLTDASGVSGTGRVLDGVVFHTGQCVICWRTKIGSIAIYNSLADFMALHVKSHPKNKTEIVWMQ